MKVHVNGREAAVAGGATVAALVEELGLAERRVAVEVNRSVVSRNDWTTTTLDDDDEIEIVQFVGGG